MKKILLVLSLLISMKSQSQVMGIWYPKSYDITEKCVLNNDEIRSIASKTINISDNVITILNDKYINPKINVEAEYDDCYYLSHYYNLHLLNIKYYGFLISSLTNTHNQEFVYTNNCIYVNKGGLIIRYTK